MARPSIAFRQIDLLDLDRTATLLAEIGPTIMYNATTLQSWWVVNELPREVNAKLYRDKWALGRWSALHLGESYPRALELRTRFLEIGRSHGVVPA
jgi:hypothetical protein